jgi:uncharacterized protein (TIGR01777 family)
VRVRVVMAGASGFLGSRLRAYLAAAGHEIVQLVRREPATNAQVRWYPDRGDVDRMVLRAADVVVNLAGAGVADRRWTPAYKTLLRTSRVEPTRTLARALAELPAAEAPTLLNASAVGFYGDRGDEVLDEDSPPGEGFLSELCIAWESATTPASDAGVRVVNLRTGLPLDTDGGVLKPLLLPFRLGIGGKLAGGRMWMPLISMRDWLAAVEFLMGRADIAGPVNVAGPEPVRNAELTTVLGRLLHRPTLAPVPAFALRTLLGEVSQDILSSDRAVPRVLLGAGFTFRDTDLTSALHAAGL